MSDNTPEAPIAASDITIDVARPFRFRWREDGKTVTRDFGAGLHAVPEHIAGHPFVRGHLVQLTGAALGTKECVEQAKGRLRAAELAVEDAAAFVKKAEAAYEAGKAAPAHKPAPPPLRRRL